MISVDGRIDAATETVGRDGSSAEEEDEDSEEDK